MQKLRIFVAAPSDMAVERTRVETIASRLKPLADSLGIVLETLDWGSVIPNMGRPEEVILEQLEPTTWDVVIGILWHRFGTPSGGKDPNTKRIYQSGTEEEFSTAYRLWKQVRRPRIMMYRCTRSIPPGALEPDQYKRVEEFFKQFDATTGEHPGLYKTFNTSKSFESLLFDNLQKLLLEYGESRKITNYPRVESRPRNIFICYRRSAQEDRALAEYLKDQLASQGHNVFIDISMRAGKNWLEEIDTQIKSSDYLIVLVSKESADSEMVQAEVYRAYEYRHRFGHPQTLPIRIRFEGLLPYTISAFLSPYQQLSWQTVEDNARIAREITQVLNGQWSEKIEISKETPWPIFYSEDGRAVYSKEEIVPPLPEFDPRLLDAPGGALKLSDRFYIERDVDKKLKNGIAKKGETITIRASRQSGKSSLLVRGIHHARAVADIIHIDLQSLEHKALESNDKFAHSLATAMARKLKLEIDIVERIWKDKLDSQDKLTKFIEDHIIFNNSRQIVLAIDEADRLLSAPFSSDFFSLVRSWHNNRALDEEWNKLNIVMVIATEPYLLIADPTVSPFNVGIQLDLKDFDHGQVDDLNQRHRAPIKGKDFESFFDVLGGHPFLTRKGLYLLVTEYSSWDRLLQEAADEQGPFGDHLRRQHWLLRESVELREALRQVIRQNRCSDDLALRRLLRAGLVKNVGKSYYCRCGLYERFFKDKLK